jgi:hypothetical protein
LPIGRFLKSNSRGGNRVILVVSIQETLQMRLFAKVLTVCCVLLGLSSYTSISAQEPKNKTDRSKVRVGTFDSRLVATAYVRSESFQRRLARMHADLKDAKASGDEKRVKQLEAEGPALQDLIHKQGFSTWPVHDILQTIKEQMPGIAEQARVDMLVSKWDVVFQRKDVEMIDVTDLMVEPFSPTEETRKVLASLRKQDPVPLAELKKHE